MPRRKPASAKQRKAELQLHRAIKRGDVPPSDSHPANLLHPRTGPKAFLAKSSSTSTSSRRLQSSFIKISPEFLDRAKHLAFSLPIIRPIPLDNALFPDNFVDPRKDREWLGELTTPRRPKWRYDMAKLQVEKNEEAVFARWLNDTDSTVDMWLRHRSKEKSAAISHESQFEDGHTQTPHPNRPLAADHEDMPPSPTHYERNLEVWRQLWRVTEISQILLILLDSRCPPLHYPPSLHAYLSDIRPARRLILVLTKVDISGPARASLWSAYLSSRYPDVRIVQVESYIEKPSHAGKGQNKRYEPHIPNDFKQQLVDALREAHEYLCTPPVRIRDNEEMLKSWKPSVRKTIDWQGLLRTGGENVSDTSELLDGEDEGLEYLTVGVIGQPNVGKSSLLNALFGTHKVKASRTPGKTKHFQTLFWTPEVRLVDCPGLVFPNYVGIEMQALSGILSISQIASIPSCIYHALQYLPLERIFQLRHPSSNDHAIRDKRTWRDSAKLPAKKEVTWTAMDVLIAFAEDRGWLTAKAGRPDVNRAGNYILRVLAEAKVRWAFWPPGTNLDSVSEEESTGIWIRSENDGKEDGGEVEDEVVPAHVSDESDSEDVSSGGGGRWEDEDDGSQVEYGTRYYGRFESLAEDAGDSEGA